MTISIEDLRNLVEQSRQTNPHLTSRLEKAAFLVLVRSIVFMEEDYYRIMSEDGLRWYEIRDGHCECTDYARHGPGHPCKHRLAIALSQKLKLSKDKRGKAQQANSQPLQVMGTNGEEPLTCSRNC